MSTKNTLLTIERIQDSMVSLEEKAYSLGMTPVEYVRQKDMFTPTNQEEYIHSMAELGIESDISSDDTLSWTFDIDEIEATLDTYPINQYSLDNATDVERDILKQLLNRPPSNSNHSKSNEGNNIQFE